MTKNQLKELMEYLQAIDNRQLTAEKLQVWFDLIGHLDFDLAKRALLQACSDISIQYVEAKHIIAICHSLKDKARQAKEQDSRKDEPERTWTPQPKCIHGVGLLSCDPCCRNAAIQAGLIKAN
jgi:hypothetical protein